MCSKHHIKPPKYPLRLFRWFIHPDYQEDIEGDLLERFDTHWSHRSKSAAQVKFTTEILKLLRPSLIRPIEGYQKLNYLGMLKNYFKTSFRNIIRHKTFSFLNISGLSIGITSCILILIYVQNERSFDQYHEHKSDIYRILQTFRSNAEAEETPNPDISEYQVWGNAPVGLAMQNDFPEIETVFRFTSPQNILVSYESKRFQETNWTFADSTAFEVFSWDLIVGDPKTALTTPYSVVLSKSTARKYFGDLNPIGQVLKIDQNQSAQVTGVMEDIPHNSHFRFDAFISMTTFHEIRPNIFSDWGYVDFYTYLKLQPQANASELQAKLPGFVSKYLKDWTGYSLLLEPLSDAYLHSKAQRQPGTVGSLTNVYVFTSIAVFILLIAAINFMNLSTARSVERAKEVAIRKTVGSQRIYLIFQFICEAVILTWFAGLLAAGLVTLCHPYLEILSGKVLAIDWLLTLEVLSSLFLGISALGLLAGSYPALVLSRFKPVQVLKGAFKTSAKGVILRKSLVVLQFSISIILLVGTTVVYTQLNHLRNHEKGFDSEQMLIIDFGWDPQVQNKREYFKSQFLKRADVLAAAVSRAVPGDFFPNGSTAIRTPDGAFDHLGPGIYEIDEDFIPTFNINLTAGRNYSREFPLDSANALIINEATARLFGYNDPQEVIGKEFDQWGRQGTVVGVVEDFNYVSLHSKVEPLALRYGTPGNTTKISLKLKSDNYVKTLRDLEELWNQLAPQRPFTYNFLDNTFDAQYKEDERFGQVFTVFAGIAILIACLGLFGLTIYSTAQRTKEIGIRKVLGASAQSILQLLSWDFLKLFAISLVIAGPIAWFIMSSWLQDFAYSIEMGWQVFTIATLITLVVSLATMSLKTISAAIANPVDALRNE